MGHSRRLDSLEGARGLIPGVAPVRVFGATEGGVQTSDSDIWRYADSTGQQTWLAPTGARVHSLVSTSTDDATLGTGAHVVRVYGLTDWDSKEVYEEVSLSGTTPVNTAGSYVMVNRLVVSAAGVGSLNEGTITATAATDTTVSAVIAPGTGWAQQAILGIPSVQNFYVTEFGAQSGRDEGNARNVITELKVNSNPATRATFAHSGLIGMVDGQAGPDRVELLSIPELIEGPAVVKMTAHANGTNTDVSAWFSGWLINEN